ncbi:MAG: tetratricopeptide repeat protein [Phycisphaerae bacterium]
MAKSPAADQSKAINSDNRISSIRTSRLGSFLTQKKPSTPSVRKQPLTSQSSRISSSKTQPAEAGQRLGSLIGKEKTSIPMIRRLTRGNEPKQNTAQTSQSSSSGVLRILQSIDKKSAEKRAEAGRIRKSINLRVVDRLPTSSREKKVVPENRTTIINTNVISDVGKVGDNHIHGVGNVSSRHVAHRDYHPGVRYIHRHEHVYWDRYNRLCHRIIWPRYRFMVHYSHGPYFTFQYVYPYHFRRYIFVSLGGYWPIRYRCIRYYWYGCHPYRWYGYYPIAYEVEGDTYNYYTYNYYYDDYDTVASMPSQVADGIKPVDHNTFADVREKLAQQAAEEPDAETLADTHFDEAVKAFEAGNYEIAIEKFAKAMELAPDDMVLPFAYSQALFASEQYSEAAKVLRETLAKVSPEKEAVFYPRGLYSDDDILFEQIERLTQKAELYSFDADLQLLLGYQLLGIGEIDKAVEPLQQASQDLENADAATILLDLLAKIKTDTETENSD